MPVYFKFSGRVQTLAMTLTIADLQVTEVGPRVQAVKKGQSSAETPADT